MENIKTTVLFDTNSYRKIAHGKSLLEAIEEVSAIKKNEKRKNIHPSAITSVAIELLGNLTDENNKYNYTDCLHSLICMGKHCYQEDDDVFRIIPTPYGQLAKVFFNVEPAEFNYQLKNLAALITHFGKNHQEALRHYKKQNTYQIAQKFLIDGESNFIENVIKLVKTSEVVIRDKNPSATEKQLKIKLLKYLNSNEFENVFAFAILQTVSQVLNIKMADIEIANRAAFLVKEFPITVGFFKFIFNKIVDQNIDLKTKISQQKRWNWIWDYHVSFLMSNHRVSGGNVILVTSDKDMRAMLSQFGFENRIFDIESYAIFLSS